MVFSSSIFLFYFLPLFLVLYFLADRKYKNGIALLASLVFYGFGSPRFLIVLLLSILIDYFLVRQISKSEDPKRRKLFLLLSVVLNIGLLAYFKYANFFIENFNSLLAVFGSSPVKWTKVVLPIGISFFTFQKMSCSIDVYRKTAASLDNIADYALFIMLFPQLIAGPIVRYNEVAEQLVDRQANETIDNKLLGMYRFIIGLSKKMLIANIMAEYVDQVFAQPATEIGVGTAWLGILAYTFQIYFDFSGYSDMAIGIGRMIGFNFPENFNCPYISKSITEFWKRWHITLGNWMMDYLYIPLGGNRKGRGRTYLNLWIVFFLSGLWHGASWNFVVWGAYHGIFICLDKLLKGKRKEGNGKHSTFHAHHFLPGRDRLGIFPCRHAWLRHPVSWHPVRLPRQQPGGLLQPAVRYHLGRRRILLLLRDDPSGTKNPGFLLQQKGLSASTICARRPAHGRPADTLRFFHPQRQFQPLHIL